MAKLKTRRQRADFIRKVVSKEYPQPICPLYHNSAWQLLVSTLLSVQTTDAQVNKIAPFLFEKYPDLNSMVEAEIGELEQLIRSTGFYRQKAANLQNVAKIIQQQYAGKVPDTMQELIKLPSVGRKVANVVLNHAFGINEGIAVDTHVKRLSQLWGLSAHKDATKIEKDLQMLFPKAEWGDISLQIIFWGRDHCPARQKDEHSCQICKFCAN